LRKRALKVSESAFGAALQIAEVFLEHLVGFFGDVLVLVELVARFARFEFQFDGKRPGFGPVS
jgi:hypothetical protein